MAGKMVSRFLVRFLAPILAAGLMIALSVYPSFAGSIPAKSAAPRAPSVANAPSSIIGVEATGWSGSTGTSLGSEVQASGAQWTRINEIQWSVVQPQESSALNFSSYDAFLSVPAADGLTPIVIIGDTPAWAGLAGAPPSGPIDPTHLGEFVSFVRAAVQRYSAPPYNIHHWELFNEPDGTLASNAPWESTWGNYGAQYAQMLQAVYPAIKAIDPQATVIMGSLAYDWFTTQGGPFNQNFLPDVLAAGGGNYFDTLGFHYYALFADDWAPYGIDILGKYNYLRSVMSSYGLSTKPMMCTELGQTGTPGDTASLQTQADYVPQVYARAMSAGLQAGIWYSLVIGTSDTGLIDSTNSPKPAYTTYQMANTEFANTTFVETIPTGSVQLQGASAQTFEGYVLSTGSGYRAVVWLSSGSGTLSFPAASASVTSENGGPATPVAAVNGTVSVAVGTSPVYLDLSTNPWAATPTSTATATGAPSSTPTVTPSPVRGVVPRIYLPAIMH